MVKAIKITLLILVCLCLVAFMYAFIKSDFKFSNMTAKLVFDEQYELKDIESINIDVTSSDIKIYESSDDKINVKIYSDDKDNIKVNEDEKTLSIVNKQKGAVCFGFCFGNRKVELYVPKDYLGKFDIHATSGDIVSSLATSNDYNIRVTSGDIKIDNVNSLTGKATSGDIEIERLNSYINFKTTSGDIDIDIATINKDSSIKVTSGDVEINKFSGAYVNASAKSGDINVSNNDRHAEYELTITTTSGDIEIN